MVRTCFIYKKTEIVLQNACTVPSLQRQRSTPVAPNPHLHLVVSVLWSLAILTGGPTSLLPRLGISSMRQLYEAPFHVFMCYLFIFDGMFI